MAQLVKHPTLDLGSGHDLRVCEFKSCIGLCAYGAESGILSLCSSLAVSKQINKLKKKNK